MGATFGSFRSRFFFPCSFESSSVFFSQFSFFFYTTPGLHQTLFAPIVSPKSIYTIINTTNLYTRQGLDQIHLFFSTKEVLHHSYTYTHQSPLNTEQLLHPTTCTLSKFAPNSYEPFHQAAFTPKTLAPHTPPSKRLPPRRRRPPTSKTPFQHTLHNPTWHFFVKVKGMIAFKVAKVNKLATLASP